MKRHFPNSIYYNPIAVVKFNSLIEWNYEVIEKRNNLKRLSKLGYKITLSRDSHTLSNPENSHFADFRIFLSFWAAKKPKIGKNGKLQEFSFLGDCTQPDTFHVCINVLS